MSDTKKYQRDNVKIIINKKLKHSYITIDKDRNISLKTPYESQDFIDRLLEEKTLWIEKKLQLLESRKSLSAEELYSQEYIESRVSYYAKQMKLHYTLLKFKTMKSRWGSCSAKGVITLNLHLKYVKKELIDYVIVHELAHLVHMNHSKCFHELVALYLPNAKVYRKELKSISITS